MSPPRERILVIKLSALGDFMLALGPMAAIRQKYPEAHITLLTTRPFLDLAQRCGYFNEIIVDSRPKFYDVSGWLTLFRHLNRAGYARVFDLQMNDRSRVYIRLLIERPAEVVPAAGSNKPQAPQHAFDRFREIFDAMGIRIAPPDIGWMTSDIGLFNIKKPYVLLVPGSSPQWPEKRWPAIKYGALGMKLQRLGYEVALIGTPAEHEVVARVVKSCPGIHDLSGRTSLYDIATLARGAAGAVGNDTGPTHIIALAGCPVVALFSGVSQPELSAPLGADVKVIQSENVGDISLDDVMQNFTPREQG